jgi:hypothetical protein
MHSVKFVVLFSDQSIYTADLSDDEIEEVGLTFLTSADILFPFIILFILNSSFKKL